MMLITGIVIGIILTVGTIYLIGQWAPTQKGANVPVTYKLRWWPLQEKLEVKALKVLVEDADLNLLKTNTSVTYTVEGILKQSENWKSYIRQVHISEILIQRENFNGAEVEIKITPVVGQKKQNGTTSESIPFTLTNTHKLHSMAWGNNKYRFICEDFEEMIELHQRK